MRWNQIYYKIMVAIEKGVTKRSSNSRDYTAKQEEQAILIDIKMNSVLQLQVNINGCDNTFELPDSSFFKLARSSSTEELSSNANCERKEEFGL